VCFNTPMKLVLATGNRKKVVEMAELLQELSVQLLMAIDFPDLEMPEEEGSTFEENARLKSRAVAAFTGLPSLADDSGLVVDALGGRPGIYSARYAGEGCSYADNNAKLLQELQGVPQEKRTARFIAVMVLTMPDGRERVAEGCCEGYITADPRGEAGFGYDPVFVPEGYDKTFAELGAEIKNRISHRAKALKKMAAIINAEYEMQSAEA
jgi:XTP/dITP diphosphohydrolase